MEQNSQRNSGVRTCPTCKAGFPTYGYADNVECDVCVAYGIDNDLGQALYELLHKRGMDKTDRYVRSLMIQRKAMRQYIPQLRARQRKLNRILAPVVQIAG